MKKILMVFTGIVFCFFLYSIGETYAEENAATDENPKQEIKSDYQEIKEQKQEMNQNAQAAKTEEAGLRQQIQDAVKAGDKETAKKLRSRLQSVHKENVQGMQQNKQEMRQDRQSLRADRREMRSNMEEARQEGNMPQGMDMGGNPPGMMGGPGEGSEQGQGMNKAGVNPPGPKGGPGTNMGNPPGPKGGPGAGPKMNKGGMNPPGPKGGPGVGMNRGGGNQQAVKTGAGVVAGKNKAGSGIKGGSAVSAKGGVGRRK